MRFWILNFIICLTTIPNFAQNKNETPVSQTSLIILGTSQDAGSPQINCTKSCCRAIFEGKQKPERVVSLGVIDPINNKQYLFEATPDITFQLQNLKNYTPAAVNEIPSGIFITHAHIGHYTGLMYLGKEVMNADQVPVYVSSRMKKFLETNGPWSQLVSNKNIDIKLMNLEEPVQLNSELTVTPFMVPHRDEFSETVGYKISGPQKSALFIPDIDKWEKWEKSILEEIKKVDFAFIDATFFSGKEIQARDISEIPHPFVIESIEMFKNLSTKEKSKIHFIHMNHTNPLLKPESKESKQIKKLGFNIARTGNRFTL